MTLDEFQNFAERLRPHTERAMMIEVAPWIKDYVADMDDLFSELILEKTKNKPAGLEVKLLKNYKDLFEEKVEKKKKVEVEKNSGKGGPRNWKNYPCKENRT